MAKANTSGKKQQPVDPRAVESGNESVAVPASSTPNATTNRKSGKNNKRQIGGTAVPGAKSTIPKPPPTSNNAQQQQAEGYNRSMRRRMQNLNGDENEQAKTMQNKRRKRIERRKERLDARRAEIRRSLPNGGKISLGRRNMYFIIGVVAIIVVLILFAVLRQLHYI